MCPARSSSRVVAVVGAGHLPGIREKWDAEIDVAAIMAVPVPRRRRLWPLALAVVGAGAGALVYVRWRHRT